MEEGRKIPGTRLPGSAFEKDCEATVPPTPKIGTADIPTPTARKQIFASVAFLLAKRPHPFILSALYL